MKFQNVTLDLNSLTISKMQCTHRLHWETFPLHQPNSPYMFWWPLGSSPLSADKHTRTVVYICKPFSYFQLWVWWIFVGCSYQACLSLSMRLVSQHNRWTHWAFINSIVNLSKESLAQDPSHNEILLGDIVPFCTQKQRHRLKKLHVSLF